MKATILFFLPLLFLMLSLSPAQCRIVETSLGALNGDQTGSFHMFKKVPFARPPLGKLRFQKPLPPLKWKGVWDATAYGPACMSNSSTTKSVQKWVDEDCLHLNVFTSDKCLNSKDCAVAFYLHGGALNYDSAVMFNDTFLLDVFVKEDIVLVIPGFRLGIFSHFVVEDQSIAPNNLGLYDILQSLQFVNHEIANFGGDPKKVTVLGHSYGGTISAMMHFSPQINRDLSLFQRTVSMSSTHYFATLEMQMEKTKIFAKYANCLPPKYLEKISRKFRKNVGDKYMLNCLQDIDAMELLRIQRLLEDETGIEYKALIQRGPLFPEAPPLEFLNTPKRIPMLTGCTRYEMDHEATIKNLTKLVGYENDKEVDEKYRRDKAEENYHLHNHSDQTIAIMLQTKLRVDALLSKDIPAYLYEYTYPKHSRHTDDLFYIMGVHPFDMDENEKVLSQVYRRMFTGFIKNGNPGFEEANKKDDSFFEVYSNASVKPHMEKHFEQDVMDYFFKDLVEYDKSISAAKLQSFRALQHPLELQKENLRSPYFYKYLSIVLVSMIFLTGCLVGRCFWPSKKNYYIRLDGNDGGAEYRPLDKVF